MKDSTTQDTPQKLSIAFVDYLTAFFSWLFLFRTAPQIKPGLYFLGDQYEKDAPVLISCNFLLTIVILYHRLKHSHVRLLVIDTKGINVWCSAGKIQEYALFQVRK